MFFDDEFIESIHKNPLAAAIEICSKVISEFEGVSGEWDEQDESILLEALALLNAMTDQGMLKSGVSSPQTNGTNLLDRCNGIYQYLQRVKSEKTQDRVAEEMRTLRQRFNTALGGGFAFEFTSGDISRVQLLISELREQIASSELFEEKHKARLLARLEALQSELHKRISDLDRFWGLIGDAGVAIGKFGKDAKPFVERIQEIAQIVWNTQARAENLPSNTPLPLLTDESLAPRLQSDSTGG